jgi:hypothetical protein
MTSARSAAVVRPHGPESRARRAALTRGVDVGLGGQRGGTERFAGGRLERAMRVAAAGVHPLPVDEEPDPVQVGVFGNGRHR